MAALERGRLDPSFSELLALTDTLGLPFASPIMSFENQQHDFSDVVVESLGPESTSPASRPTTRWVPLPRPFASTCGRHPRAAQRRATSATLQAGVAREVRG